MKQPAMMPFQIIISTALWAYTSWETARYDAFSAEMNIQEIKELLSRELPRILREDQGFRQWLLDLVRQHYVEKETFDERFDRLLREFAEDRAEQRRKWEEERAENQRKWEEWNHKWEEDRAENQLKWEKNDRKWEEWNRKWGEERAEDRRKWEEWNRKWEEERAEDRRKWEEQKLNWREQQRNWQENQAEIRRLGSRIDQTLGAMGARWGIASESAFRNALRGILQDSFQVEVLNITEYDDTGEVFGQPDQVELDIIVKDGVLIICELKSSLSKADVYIFDRKAKFYERLRQRQANRKLVISPMIDKRAGEVARALGIEVYSYVEEVPTDSV